jgi:esterase/lipase superfamily enzyme
VGYSETSKAYRIYIPSTRKTIERRDTKFEEERAFRKSYQDKYILEAEVPQQEEVSSPKSPDLPTEGQQEEEQQAFSRKRKQKCAKQLLKEASEQVKSPKTSIKTSIPP